MIVVGTPKQVLYFGRLYRRTETDTCTTFHSVTLKPNLTFRSGSSALSPDGRRFLASNLDNGMNLYSLETFTVVRSYQYTVNPETNFPLSVAFIKKGKFVVCGTHTRNVSIWETSTGEVLQTLDHSGKHNLYCR